MPFQLSPGVNVTEIDLTGIVPAVATTDGAIAGVFNWGPVGTRQLIDTETKLVDTFGKPNSNNYETWFTSSNFLSYGNRLYVTRVANTTNNDTGTISAIANSASVSNVAAQTVKNVADFEGKTFDPNVLYVARYPGALGNSLKISVCDSSSSFSSSLKMSGLAATEALDVSANLAVGIGQSYANLNVTPGSGGSAINCNTYITNLLANVSIGDYLSVGNTTIGNQNLRVTSIGAIVANSTGAFATIGLDTNYRLATAFTTNTTVNSTVTRSWEGSIAVGNAPVVSDYQAQFGNTAAVDSIHVIITDENGAFTGIPGTILETFNGLSRSSDAKTVGGQANFYKTVINQTSKYIWAVNDRSGAVSNTATSLVTSTNKTPGSYTFTGGKDGASEQAIPLGILANGYDLYKSAEDVDISLILQGKARGTIGTHELANYLIDNICEPRKDCIALISPDDSVVTGNAGNEAVKLVEWRNSVHDSSYAVMDSGYKYQYDRYNDVYRWIPCNGDIAGLCVRTDNSRDPWWSPAGFNRGQIKNLVKLRWNPRQADRDILYKSGINPLVSFPGQGTVLYGDKTLQSKPSAFDRINVRRLFIVLEKAIATASKFFLFEFNDEFTRAQFKSLITPYLRDVQGRRGITDFLVVCDGTNNTGERIDRNEFWGDIYIKPARSINFIQLNFVAVRTGVQFSEIVGKF
jgi:phage tail sheath protein FI